MIAGLARAAPGVHHAGMRRRAMLAVFALAVAARSALAFCPERPPCHGCGCKGGPGYRGPDGKCVGYRELARKCGPPPHAPCVFENAPGTGANEECALGPKPTAPPAARPPVAPAKPLTFGVPQ